MQFESLLGLFLLVSTGLVLFCLLSLVGTAIWLALNGDTLILGAQLMPTGTLVYLLVRMLNMMIDYSSGH